MEAVSVIFCVCLWAGVSGRVISPEEQMGRDHLLDELRAWKDAGQPDFLDFPGPDGLPMSVSMVQWGPEDDWERSYLKPDYKTDVHFHVFSSRNASEVEGIRLSSDPTRDELLEAGLNPKRFTKIIIHGFLNHIRSPAIQTIKSAYLKHKTEHNVIGVDWGELCHIPFYLTARSRVGSVGERVADFIDVLVREGVADPQRIHIIGHSLGAHIAGLAAKHVAAAGSKIARVTGLDPAGPFFQLTDVKGRLDATDGQVVDVVHTNAGALGFKSTLGVVDFYPNGGKTQPGCSELAGIIGTCSHRRSFDYFAESILDGCGFEGVFCGTDESAALDQACENSDKTARMGEPLQFSEEGSYLVTTADSFPYNRRSATKSAAAPSNCDK